MTASPALLAPAGANAARLSNQAARAVRRSLRPAILARTALAIERGELNAADAVESIAARASMLRPLAPGGAAARAETWAAILDQYRTRAARARRDTIAEITRYLRPLVLDRRPSAELLEAAARINRDRASVLAPREVQDVVVGLVIWLTRPRRRR